MKARSETDCITSLAPEPGVQKHMGESIPPGRAFCPTRWQQGTFGKELLARSFWQRALGKKRAESSQPWSSQRNQGAARNNHSQSAMAPEPRKLSGTGAKKVKVGAELELAVLKEQEIAARSKIQEFPSSSVLLQEHVWNSSRSSQQGLYRDL